VARLPVNGSARRTAVLAWMFLVCATLATYLLLEGHGSTLEWGISLVMVVSAIKARTIVLHYMELKHAPRGWRLAFEIWVAGTACLILGLWFLAGAAADCSPG
jgi:hypothetical protein